MRKSFVLALLSFVLLLTVSSALAQTTSSGQDTTPEAAAEGAIPLIEPGVPFTDVFFDEVGARLYGFYGSAGDVITLTMTQAEDSGLDPYLVLLGPRGEVIASDDDSGEESFSAAIEDVELPEDGSYLVVATSFFDLRSPRDESEDDQEFEINLDGSTIPEDDPNYDPDSFFLYYSELQAGAEIEGYSNEDEPVYYFTFIANEGDTVNLTVGDADFDNIIYLFDAEGNRVAVNDDTNSLDAAIEDFEVPADGIYFVMVTGFGFGSAPDGSYTGGTFTLSYDVE